MAHNLGWVAVFHVARRPISLAKDADHHRRIERTSRVVTYTLMLNIAIVALAFWFPMVALVLVTAAWLFYLFAGIFWTSIG